VSSATLGFSKFLEVGRFVFVLLPGGVRHDPQSMPGEISAGAHFRLVAERQTSPHAYGGYWKYDFTGGSLPSDAERNLE